MEYNNIERDVKEILSEFRFTHSLGVVKKQWSLQNNMGKMKK